MFEDELPKPAKHELEARIETLKAQIADCEAEIRKKQAHKSAADDFFKR